MTSGEVMRARFSLAHAAWQDAARDWLTEMMARVPYALYQEQVEVEFRWEAHPGTGDDEERGWSTGKTTGASRSRATGPGTTRS